MTSSDPNTPHEGSSDPTVIRPAEQTPSTGEDATGSSTAPADAAPGSEDATTVYNTPPADPYAAPANPYAPPADPSAQPNPYAAPADPYGQSNPYSTPYGSYGSPTPDPYGSPTPDPYAGAGQTPGQLPGYPTQQGFPGQQQGYPGQPGFPGQQGYPAYPGYGQAPESSTNGLAVASMVLGIIGILGFCFWGAGALPGIAAVVLGFIAMNQVKQTGQQGHGMALAGVITGFASIVLAIVAVVALILIINADPSSSSYVLQYLH